MGQKSIGDSTFGRDNDVGGDGLLLDDSNGTIPFPNNDIDYDGNESDTSSIRRQRLHKRHSLNLSLSQSHDESSNRLPGLDLSQLDDSGVATATNIGTAVAEGDKSLQSSRVIEQEDELESVVGKRKRGRPINARKTKRRKIITDGDDTELSSDHIRTMLANTDDIVRQDIINPAEQTGSRTSDNDDETKRRNLILNNLKYDQLFARPALGDDGQLAPALLELYYNNMCPIFGKPFPYEKDGDEKENKVEGKATSAKKRRSSKRDEPDDDDDDDITIEVTKEDIESVAGDGNEEEDEENAAAVSGTSMDLDDIEIVRRNATGGNSDIDDDDEMPLDKFVLRQQEQPTDDAAVSVDNRNQSISSDHDITSPTLFDTSDITPGKPSNDDDDDDARKLLITIGIIFYIKT